MYEAPPSPPIPIVTKRDRQIDRQTERERHRQTDTQRAKGNNNKKKRRRERAIRAEGFDPTSVNRFTHQVRSRQ